MINPLNDNVLIKVLEEEQEGGIVIPTTHRKDEFGMGEVLAVHDNGELEVGDLVVFDKVLLTCVKIKDEELKFIKFSDILGYERRG